MATWVSTLDFEGKPMMVNLDHCTSITPSEYGGVEGVELLFSGGPVFAKIKFDDLRLFMGVPTYTFS